MSVSTGLSNLGGAIQIPLVNAPILDELEYPLRDMSIHRDEILVEHVSILPLLLHLSSLLLQHFQEIGERESYMHQEDTLKVLRN